jgi:hypothetical protein
MRPRSPEDPTEIETIGPGDMAVVGPFRLPTPEAGRMKRRIALWGSMSLALVQPASAEGSGDDAAPIVRTAVGQLRGTMTADGRSAVYKGIPFAAPPIGPLRWRAPVPAAAWKGVRDASRFSADCMQRVPMPEPGRRFSEDCLYLNVWTPRDRAAGKSLPVLLWIFGGSFTHGGASQPVYDGAALAGRGVIVVTFNYRVGPLGFLAHPELTGEAGASGNYGIMDQLAALEWVHRHIAVFGGDPKRITLAGQSAGRSASMRSWRRAGRKGCSPGRSRRADPCGECRRPPATGQRSRRWACA